MEYRLRNEQEWISIVGVLMESIASQTGTIIALQGDLGVGKTTLVKSLIQEIGSDDLINSPTFSIVNEYDSSIGVIYHMDLYRLESLEELMDIGFEEYLDSGALCIIEWPEIAFPILKDNCILISITLSDNNERIVKISQYA